MVCVSGLVTTGGRMAAMEAQRYPEDFDGIISGAPALDYTGLVATFFAWLVQANTGPNGKDIITKDKVPLIRDAVAKQCGDATGLIADPTACAFRPANLTCKPGQNSDCLSEAEVTVLEKWYEGPKNSKGEQVYPGGLPKGSEPYWPFWLTGLDPAGGKLIYVFGLDFLRYMAFQDDPGERYRAGDFDFDKDPPRLAFMAAIYNAMGHGPVALQGTRRQAAHVSGPRGHGRHAAEHASGPQSEFTAPRSSIVPVRPNNHLALGAPRRTAALMDNHWAYR